MHVFVLESARDFYNFRVNHAQFYVNGNTVTIFYSSLNSYFPGINGLVTDGNKKLCCQGFILMLFQSITANKIYS